jgi:hypothetical protein
MADCPQINNTTIIGTSAVSYDSTPLPCTDVKAGDDLNTILTKFDNVICSAINSVNILTEEVMNITEDLMIIGEEIENINDQIFICCPICDFTATATELLVCEFTASASELPTCNFTGSVNQLPSCTFTGNVNQVSDTTTTTSSSSTSTSTSTTTTTTTSACTCYILSSILDFPFIGSTEFDYIDCFTDEPASITVFTETPVEICAKTGSVTEGAGDPGLIDVSESNCCIPTTTTTTTLGQCWSMTWQNDEEPPSTLYAQYTNSSGVELTERVTDLPAIVGTFETTVFVCSYS